MTQTSGGLKQQSMTGRPSLRPARQEFAKADARLGPTTNLGSITPRARTARPFRLVESPVSSFPPHSSSIPYSRRSGCSRLRSDLNPEHVTFHLGSRTTGICCRTGVFCVRLRLSSSAVIPIKTVDGSQIVVWPAIATVSHRLQRIDFWFGPMGSTSIKRRWATS
jgi:hypothetical protein